MNHDTAERCVQGSVVLPESWFMKKILIKTLLLTFSAVNLFAAAFSPRLDFDVTVRSLFPASLKTYDALWFYGEGNITDDTLITIRNHVRWMPGFSAGTAVGELTPLQFGVRVKYERYFGRYHNRFYNEVEGELDSIPITIHLSHFRAGMYATLQVAGNISVEPVVSFVWVRTYYQQDLQSIGYEIPFTYGINKTGSETAVKVTYLKPERLDFGARIAFMS